MAAGTFYQGTSQARLLALINSDNSKSYAYSTDLTFGTPADYTDDDGRNTKIDLIANPNGNYANDTVFYTRLEIGVLADAQTDTVVIPAEFPFATHDILDAINTGLGLNLTADEVQNITYTEEDETGYDLTIVAGSLAWLPSTWKFQGAPAGGGE